MKYLSGWNSQNAYLIDDRPNFALPYELTASVNTVATRALSGIEERRSLGDTLRFSLKFSVTLNGSVEITAWRNSQQAMSSEAVLVPLWVAKRAPGASHPVSASWWAVYQTGSAVQVYDTASIPGGLPADAWVVPLMVGYLTQWPEMQHITSELATVDVSFTENSNNEYLTLATYSPTLTWTAGGVSRSVFPWRANHATVPKGQAAQVTVDRSDLGQGRATADAYYPQLSARSEARSFTFADDEPWQFLRYFLDCRAGKVPIWVQGANAEARLVVDISSGEDFITVDNPSNRGSNSFIILDDRTTRNPNQVISTISSTWILSSSITPGMLADNTQVFTMALSRIAGGSVTLKFEHDTLAGTDLRFVEVPWETTTPGGETIGTAFGPLPDSAYLYRFAIPYPSGAQAYKYTDYAKSITYSSETYTPDKIEHGDIRIALGLERQSVQIKKRANFSDPFWLMFPFRLEYPLKLEIFEVDVVSGAATNVRRVFSGEVTTCKGNGPILTAVAKSYGALLDRKIPRLLIQPTCNHSVYDTGCGLAKASFKYDALTVTSGSSTSVCVIDTILKGGVGQSGIAAHFFAGGMITIGLGANAVTRWISDSAAQSGGQIAVTLASTIPSLFPGATNVVLYPGCDGRYATCTSKFSNGAKFGGFPFAPIGNPSLIRISKNLSVGGKK